MQVESGWLSPREQAHIRYINYSKSPNCKFTLNHQARSMDSFCCALAIACLCATPPKTACLWHKKLDTHMDSGKPPILGYKKYEPSSDHNADHSKRAAELAAFQVQQRHRKLPSVSAT